MAYSLWCQIFIYLHLEMDGKYGTYENVIITLNFMQWCDIFCTSYNRRNVEPFNDGLSACE